MIERQSLGVINVQNVNLWAHVGALDQERLHGQSFLLDFKIWLNVHQAAVNDDLSKTADYSHAIKAIQQLSFELDCHTIECFCERILDCLENLYGQVPVHVFLRKCSAPIPGFTGTVGIEMSRYLPIENLNR